MPPERIMGVETGGCPHTAIREDASINLAATFSPKLAPLVGADLGVMDRDARRMRGERPFLFTNLKEGHGVAEVRRFIEQAGGLRV